MITRIASLRGFDGVLLGRDIAKIFKPGHVYQATEVMGEIIIRDLGEHAEDKRRIEGSTISAIAISGIHCLTKAEYQLQKEQENEG